MVEALHYEPRQPAGKDIITRALRSFGLATNSDNIRWSVVGPAVAVSFLSLAAVIGTVFYAAGGISKSVADQSTDMADIKKQLGVQASALTHLDDEFHFGAARMDLQDKAMAAIGDKIDHLNRKIDELDERERQQPVPIRAK